MGVKLSKSEDYEKFLANYLLEKQILLEQFEDSMGLYNNISNPNISVVQLEKSFNPGEADAKEPELIAFLESKKNSLESNVAAFQIATISVNKIMCYQSKMIKMLFQHAPMTLKNHIEASNFAQFSKDPTPMSDIEPFVKHMTSALAYFEASGRHCGFVTPGAILVSRENGKLKFLLSDFGPAQSYSHMYQRMVADRHYKAPLDPELMALWSRQQKEVNYKIAYDKYALGICLLCFLMKRPEFSYYYNWDLPAIKEDLISSDFNTLKAVKYDPRVLRFLSDLLAKDPTKRLSMVQTKNAFFPDGRARAH